MVEGIKRNPPEEEEDNNGEEDDEDEMMNGDSPFDEKTGLPRQWAILGHRREMEMQTQRRTVALLRVLNSLKCSPMDVTLPSETNVGKRVREAVRVMKKLMKRINKGEGEKTYAEMEELLRGYPRFWVMTNWHWDKRFNVGPNLGGVGRGARNCDDVSDEMPLVLLQRILQAWKDMAAENDTVAVFGIPMVTCSRGKDVSAAQHRVNMQLLHSSPTWRSLYLSLREREAAVKKSHGDRMRSRREGLEKDRPKVGKVVLRASVGRVRGGDCDGRNSGGSSKHPLKANGSGSVVVGRGKRERRQKTILSKSLGHRARRQNLARNLPSSAATGGGGNGAFARIRTQSKVAASWSKSSFGGGGGISAGPKSSFGASVASAAGARNGSGGDRATKTTTAGKHPGKIHMPLGNGKRMTPPASALLFAGRGRPPRWVVWRSRRCNDSAGRTQRGARSRCWRRMRRRR